MERVKGKNKRVQVPQNIPNTSNPLPKLAQDPGTRTLKDCLSVVTPVEPVRDSIVFSMNACSSAASDESE